MDCRYDVNAYLSEVETSSEVEWERKHTDQDVNRIPDDMERIPLEKPHWLRVKNVAAVYADMVGSTYVSLRKYQHFATTARIYQVFTGNMARMMNDYGVEYMDIQGDGILGLWSGETARYPAFCCAVTIKTFTERWFRDWVTKKTDGEVSVDVHIGMDEYSVHVKRIGMRGEWRRKEVWAGQPVNLAVKLCDMAEADQIVASDRLYQAFGMDEIYKSCGCPDGQTRDLWVSEAVDAERFGFETAWRLGTHWCKTCGSEYCRQIMSKSKAS